MRTYQVKIRVPRVAILEGHVEVEAEDRKDAIAKVYAGAGADAEFEMLDEETMWHEMTAEIEPWSARAARSRS